MVEISGNIFSGGPKIARFVAFFGVFIVGMYFAYALYALGTWQLGTMIINIIFAAAILWGVLQMVQYKKSGWVINCVFGVLMLARGLGGSVAVSTELTFFQAMQPYVSLILGLIFLVGLFPLRSFYLSK